MKKYLDLFNQLATYLASDLINILKLLGGVLRRAVCVVAAAFGFAMLTYGVAMFFSGLGVIPALVYEPTIDFGIVGQYVGGAAFGIIFGCLLARAGRSVLDVWNLYSATSFKTSVLLALLLNAGCVGHWGHTIVFFAAGAWTLWSLIGEIRKDAEQYSIWTPAT